VLVDLGKPHLYDELRAGALLCQEFHELHDLFEGQYDSHPFTTWKGGSRVDNPRGRKRRSESADFTDRQSYAASGRNKENI
jgi:hypothetical protein